MRERSGQNPAGARTRCENTQIPPSSTQNFQSERQGGFRRPPPLPSYASTHSCPEFANHKVQDRNRTVSGPYRLFSRGYGRVDSVENCEVRGYFRHSSSASCDRPSRPLWCFSEGLRGPVRSIRSVRRSGGGFLLRVNTEPPSTRLEPDLTFRIPTWETAITDSLDVWEPPVDAEDTVAYGQPPVVREEKEDTEELDQ